jgi:hypothetical protein
VVLKLQPKTKRMDYYSTSLPYKNKPIKLVIAKMYIITVEEVSSHNLLIILIQGELCHFQ